MSQSSKKQGKIQESRFYVAGLLVLAVMTGLGFRLWYIQVYKGEYYRKIADRNRIRKIEIPAPRGNIFDRHGELVLGNRPFYDLVYVPQFVQKKEPTLKILSQLLHVPLTEFERMLRANRGRPKFLPITLKRNLSLHEVSIVENNRVYLPGIEVAVAPRRDYTSRVPAHMVGYLGEINSSTLQRKNKIHKDNPYLPGDLIGKQGLESRWEDYLRGKRGYRILQVDAFGRQNSEFERQGWNLPRSSARPGSDITLTIDLDLQEATKKAFNGKYGAVVVLNVQTGEILSMVSSPDYNPEMYQKSLSYDKWNSLISDPFKPLLDKTTGGQFAPGSVYKAVVALAALEEKVINTSTKHLCKGSFELGGDIFHCHHRGGHGRVNLEQAMMKSCDIFFYQAGVELGVDRIAKYARGLGLGQKLGVRLNMERSGLVPTSSWKKTTKGVPWTAGDTPSVAIGQGANEMTPIQMASLYATIATKGTQMRPYLVRSITNPIGENVLEHHPEKILQVQNISQRNFEIVRKTLEKVVMDDEGTGKNARVRGQVVAGKTGSVQVVSLKKNRNQIDVSMKWKEHAVFAAFTPMDNPEIAISVISQNDRVGGGGASAAPVAGKIIEAWYRLKEERQNLATKAPYSTRKLQ